MAPYLLVINAGSSSIKFATYHADGAGDPVADVSGQVEGIGASTRFEVKSAAGDVLAGETIAGQCDFQSAMHRVRDWLGGHYAGAGVLAVGHRVVHGGPVFSAPVRVDAATLATLEGLVPFDPLHLPNNLDPIRVLMQDSPEIPQVACFDTAFHATQPAVATRLALPRKYGDEGLRRYGFHGLSYEYIASVLPELAPKLARGRVVVAHLGNGASLCGMKAGQSVATTMGFTVLDGLVMGTRCGALDPGVLLYLMDRHGMDARGLEKMLYHESGLLGVSGMASDMRTLEGSTDPRAREAIELFVYRLSRELGSMVAALGGIEALVFTGGIGEHSAGIRAEVCRQARWLGVELDELENERHARCISTVASETSAWVVATDENLMIARHTLATVRGR